MKELCLMDNAKNKFISLNIIKTKINMEPLSPLNLSSPLKCEFLYRQSGNQTYRRGELTEKHQNNDRKLKLSSRFSSDCNKSAKKINTFVRDKKIYSEPQSTLLKAKCRSLPDILADSKSINIERSCNLKPIRRDEFVFRNIKLKELTKSGKLTDMFVTCVDVVKVPSETSHFDSSKYTVIAPDMRCRKVDLSNFK